MSMNKQSNLYTVFYIVVMVLVVGTALAFTSLSLRDKQQANDDADKMRQILTSARIPVTRATAIELFDQHIKGAPVYKADGTLAEADGAFKVDIAKESKKPESERLLPLYVCQTAPGETKYIVPLAGNGLWGPIWGYVAFDATPALTIYGVYFDHQGETPGLGAEITKPAFTTQFEGKSPLGPDGQFLSVAVVKKGMKPLVEGQEYVDAISGGTITSKGVASMLENCLRPYRKVLEKLTSETQQSR